MYFYPLFSSRYESEAEERRREALALEQLQEEESRSQRMKNAEDVQQQIRELKLKEDEAAMLRCEENRLIEHEKELLQVVSSNLLFGSMKRGAVCLKIVVIIGLRHGNILCATTYHNDTLVCLQFLSNE